MIVCHKRKYVFLHVPKTGGTSIQFALGLRDRPGRGARLPRSAKIVKSKHAVVADRIPQGYFAFTFVRNPFDRILSYYMFRRDPRNRRRKSIHPDERKISFKHWLILLPEFAKYHRIGREFKRAIRSQSRLLRNAPDFIGRFENLNTDFATICERIGISAPRPLKNINASSLKTEPFQRYYTPETVDIVAKMYYDDIYRFGYEIPDV